MWEVTLSKSVMTEVLYYVVFGSQKKSSTQIINVVSCPVLTTRSKTLQRIVA